MAEKIRSGKRPILLIALAVLAISLAWAIAGQVSPAFADEGASEASAAAAETQEAASEAAPDIQEASGETSSKQPVEQGKDDALPKVLGGIPLMGNDYVWFGRNLELGQHSFANDIVAAGQIVNLTDCTASGSIRAAAQNIVITDSSVDENITVAAETVTIKDGKANAIAAAGRTVTVSGSCKELTAYAEKVFIDATVEGDVVVGANTVEVGTNARIKGTLHVSAASDPVMQRGAEVGNVEFKQTDSSSTKDAERGVAALGGMFTILSIVIGIVATLLIAVLAEWLFRRHTVAAANMIRTRTGATIGTGIIGAFVAPIAVIILFCLIITIPVAAAMTFALFALTCVATGFAGASLFKLAFPKLGRFQCALAGGAIMGVASAIPFLGAFVSALAFMYLLGYVLQSIFLGLRDSASGASGASGAMPAPTSAAPAAPYAGVTPAAPSASAAPGTPVGQNDSVASTAPSNFATPVDSGASNDLPTPPMG